MDITKLFLRAMAPHRALQAHKIALGHESDQIPSTSLRYSVYNDLNFTESFVGATRGHIAEWVSRVVPVGAHMVAPQVASRCLRARHLAAVGGRKPHQRHGDGGNTPIAGGSRCAGDTVAACACQASSAEARHVQVTAKFPVHCVPPAFAVFRPTLCRSSCAHSHHTLLHACTRDM